MILANFYMKFSRQHPTQNYTPNEPQIFRVNYLRLKTNMLRNKAAIRGCLTGSRLMHVFGLFLANA